MNTQIIKLEKIDRIDVSNLQGIRIRWDRYTIIFPKEFEDKELVYYYREPNELLQVERVKNVLEALGFEGNNIEYDEIYKYLWFAYDIRNPKIFLIRCDPFSIVTRVLGKKYALCAVDVDKVRYLWSKFITWLTFNLYLDDWVKLFTNLVVNSNLASSSPEPPLLLLPVKLDDDEKLLLCVLDPYEKYEYVATRIAFTLCSRQI